MAFTKNPVEQTQSTKRISFVGAEQLRGTDVNKDQRFVNFMPEIVNSNETSQGGDKKVYIKTRAGMTNVYDMPAGEPRGIFYWSISGGHLISVIGNGLYYDNVLLALIGTVTGPVGFTEFLDSTGARKLILVDGTNGYVFTGYNIIPTQIPDPDFPSPHIPQPVFFDGYLFIAKAGTQDIYNSVLNDPLTWNTGEFISAEMYPDLLVGLTKNNNYIYGVGAESVEYFYDAANATGTPLARHESAIQQFGTPASNSVAATDKEVLMIGQTAAGGFTVWSIEGFKSDEISNTTIREALDAEGPAIANATGYCFRASAQKLYVIILTSRILVYSLDNKMWHEWQFANIPYFTSDSTLGYPYVLVNDGSVNHIAKMDPTVFTDLGVANTGTITTNRLDFDTIDRKRCDLLAVVGDAPNNASDVSLGVQWSDDDYQTWTTIRNMMLNPIISVLYRLGIFRRRSFRFTYNNPYPWRAEGMEITINKGIT